MLLHAASCAGVSLLLDAARRIRVAVRQCLSCARPCVYMWDKWRTQDGVMSGSNAFCCDQNSGSDDRSKGTGYSEEGGDR